MWRVSYLLIMEDKLGGNEEEASSGFYEIQMTMCLLLLINSCESFHILTNFLEVAHTYIPLHFYRCLVGLLSGGSCSKNGSWIFCFGDSLTGIRICKVLCLVWSLHPLF